MSVLSFSSNAKMYYVVYKEFGIATQMQYNIFDYQEARDIALTWAAHSVNRLATVFSITTKDPSPKKEYEVNNQYVAVEEAQKAS